MDLHANLGLSVPKGGTQPPLLTRETLTWLPSLLATLKVTNSYPPFIVPAKENPLTLTQNSFFLHHTELLLKTINE